MEETHPTFRRVHRRGARAVLAGVLTALLTLVGGPAVAPTAASGAGRWAPAGSATITPGVQMLTAGAQCTGNFVFTDARGRVYVGYAAHCASRGGATDTDGCTTPSLPLGTPVRFVEGSSLVSLGTEVGRGRLVYSSWLAMQRRGTRNAEVCGFNDFALVRVDRAHVRKVNPSVPFWGGPTRLDTDGLGVGQRVFSYQSSQLRGGVTALSPKSGLVTGSRASGWAHYVYTATPGVPGDSGSGVLDPSGRAVGTLSTVAYAPVPGENGIGDLAHELRFAQRHSGIRGLRLVPGTEPFNG